MNPSYPSPDDSDLASRSTQIEQKLKQLQPRPADFDAETILHAARDPERQVTLADHTGRARNSRSAGWLAISAACVGGAVFGSLLTFLVLMRGDTGDSVTAIEKESEPQPKVVTAASSDIPNDVTGDVPREDLHPDSQWSRSEWLVTAQLVEMRGPRLQGEPPLMAGNYALHSTSMVSHVEDSAVSESEGSVDLPSTSGYGSESERPTRSIDRNLLLDELLGVGSRSRL
jgi:hypothetical protein